MAGIDEHTLLLLHGENLEDSSQYHVIITNTGTTVSAAKSRFGGASLYFNGQSRLNAPAIDFGSSDFTVDWWENCDAMTGSSGSRFSDAFVTDSKYGNLLIGWKNMVFMSGNFTSWNMIQGGAVMDSTVGEWVHWAFVRNGTSFKSYKNGKLFYSAVITEPIAYSPQSQLAIGQWKQSNPDAFKGYIDEFRISNVARWVSDFTPPSQPYGLDTPETPPNFMATQNEESVTLSWEPSEKSTGYRLRKNGSVLYDGTALTFSDTLEPYVSYQYALAAYNEHGESDPAMLSASYKPNPIPSLVTDRTQADVDAWNTKGMYTEVDLNRVGIAIQYVFDKLNAVGYAPNVNPKVDWTEDDHMSPYQASVYLHDLVEMRSQYAMLPTTPNVPKTMENLTYQKANDIEQILLDVYDQYLTMLTTYVACGVATCGGDYI